jgi:hypothetical protein
MRPASLAARARLRACALSLAPLSALAAFACNTERKAECDQFLAAMKPLGESVPTTDAIQRVQTAVAAIHFQDAPLSVYAKNYTATLTVLSKTLELKASAAPPDGTDAVIKTNLKDALTDAADTARYCAQ